MKQLRERSPTDSGISDGHVTKLKRVRNRCKIPFFGALVMTATAAVSLVGCPTRPNATQSYPPASEQRRIPGQMPPDKPHEGRPYDIASGDSLLTLLVFRGGALAKAGHNHVIASHALSGTLYVPVDLVRTTFEVHVPVTELTIDEASLRAQQNDPEFPPDVPDSAKEGTRKNMLGSALLDAEHYPDIVLQSSSLEEVPHGWLAHVTVTVRDHTTSIAVPVQYEAHGGEIVVSGQFPLKQSDLGLTPFSALLGALQVVDEMKVKIRLVATSAPTRSAAR
jgi:polyisoprenoid-binding protein YceI